MVVERFHETADFLRSKGVAKPATGIILGTGLGKLVDQMDVHLTLDYKDIPHFPVSTVEFHHGKLIYGELEGKKVLGMRGRFHYYEGYTLQEVTFPVRVMKLLGIQRLLISNAGGSMNPAFVNGSLMMLDDHINLFPGSPLIGKNHDALGPRFPDMSEPYSRELRDRLARIASSHAINLNRGVYAGVPGPNLETPAEYRYLRRIGADVVGMSTIPEVIVANHMGLPCVAISVITDECDPDNLKPIVLEEVLKMAAIGEDDLIVLFRELVREL
ncbi:MAG: purine-nucleoside phosphorylase [Bacteroidales bacterium]